MSYSSAIIGTEIASRIKDVLGDKPLVLDREFSYLVLEQVNFVIRLKLGAHFFDQESRQVLLSVTKGETHTLNKVFYRGKVFVNLIGRWNEAFNEPIWSMTNLPAEQGLDFYLQLKIEQAFNRSKI